MQAAFNRATTSVKRPLAESDTYRTGTIFDYTRPEFPSMLNKEGRDKLWKTQLKTTSSVDKPYYSVLENKIRLNPKRRDPMDAEHEAIHALSIGDKSLWERLKRSVDPLFWKNLTPKQKQGIKDKYGVTSKTGLDRAAAEYQWIFSKNQEAPAVLWEVVKGNPRAVSLYSAAVPFFQKYFRPEFFE